MWPVQRQSGRTLGDHFLILRFVSTDTYSASWLEIREHSAQTPQVLLTSQDKQTLCHQDRGLKCASGDSTGRAGPEDSSAWSSQPPACEEAASVSDGQSEPASSQRAAGAWPCADTRHPTLSAPTYGSRFESYPFLTTEEMEGLELHGWLRAAVWLHGAESDPEPVLSALSLAPSRVGEDKIGKGLWDLQNAVCDSC